MMQGVRLTICLFVSLFVSVSAALADRGQITGIYTGSMHLLDGVERTIPLSVSLVLTDETYTTATGIEYVIDGAFIVDDEGGPYTFVRVAYDFEDNRIDMKYSRPRNDPTTVSPASLRLVGSLEEGGVIKGRVTSGSFGPIGTFELKKNDELKTLVRKLKYVGRWTGTGQNVKFNKRGPISIVVQESSMNTTNPPGFEFEFTPGRFGGFSQGETWLATFNSIVVDYLRRKIIMQDSSGSITIEADINPETRSLTGFQASGAYGITTTFENMPKVK